MSGRPGKWIGLGVAVVVAAAAGYLLAWPAPIEPVRWIPPDAPPLEGVFAVNDRLAGVERLGEGVAVGAEAVAIDRAGRVYTGTRDGKILRLVDWTDGRAAFEVFAETGGRPLGLSFGPDGRLFVADARRGLLAVTPEGAVTVLATACDGLPFGFTDDVDVAADGTVYFSDASSKFGPDAYVEDVIEHGAWGRVMAWRPGGGKVELIAGGLTFANGVAVAPDQQSIVFTETGSYRVMRVWLRGRRKGAMEVVVENLPGFPDNVTWSEERNAYWVALFAPRSAVLDATARYPFWRRVLWRLPAAVRPGPRRHAMAVAIDERGGIVDVLQDGSEGAFAPLTSVREKAGVLWLGSVTGEALGRIKAP